MNHPNIVRYISDFATREHVFLVQELAPGLELYRRVAHGGPLAEPVRAAACSCSPSPRPRVPGRRRAYRWPAPRA